MFLSFDCARLLSPPFHRGVIFVPGGGLEKYMMMGGGERGGTRNPKHKGMEEARRWKRERKLCVTLSSPPPLLSSRLCLLQKHPHFY